MEEIWGSKYVANKRSSLYGELWRYAETWIETNENIDDAVKQLKFCLLLSPDYVRKPAELLIQAGEYDTALEVYGPEYIKNHQDKTFELFLYANTWAKAGRNIESALFAIKKAMELDTRQLPRHYHTLSLVHWKMKNYEDALKAEEEAIKLSRRPNEEYAKQLQAIKAEMNNNNN